MVTDELTTIAQLIKGLIERPLFPSMLTVLTSPNTKTLPARLPASFLVLAVPSTDGRETTALDSAARQGLHNRVKYPHFRVIGMPLEYRVW